MLRQLRVAGVLLEGSNNSLQQRNNLSNSLLEALVLSYYIGQEVRYAVLYDKTGAFPHSDMKVNGHSLLEDTIIVRILALQAENRSGTAKRAANAICKLIQALHSLLKLFSAILDVVNSAKRRVSNLLSVKKING